MIIDLIAGARPNFIKIAPLIETLEAYIEKGLNLRYRLIHTGQHYDKSMSSQFFEDLGIPGPYINFGVGSGTQAVQTASIMISYEKLLKEEKSDLCIVVGDVNSTMACSIVAKKCNIKVAHVEAGIRSRDMSMPEEINRIVTDSITDYFFVTSKTAQVNLINEGVNQKNIFFVGNVMIDTLYKFLDKLRKPLFWDTYKLEENQYILLTLHRPSNVDKKEKLNQIIEEIHKNSRNLPIIFPVHPRTLKTLKELSVNYENLYLVSPMSYLEFIYLTKNAKVVITDSGGITEETTVLSVPCITFRSSTERPETVEVGTNELIGDNPSAIKSALTKLFQGDWKEGSIPEKWDGKTAERIFNILLNNQ